MGSKQTQTATSKQDPWKPAQPALNDILSNVQTLGGNADLFAPTQGGTTQQGISALTTIGTSPTATGTAAAPVVQGSGQGFNAGLDTLMKTATGSVDPSQNPAFMDALKSANQRTTDQVNSQFSGLGRYGSGANTLALARALNETNTSALANQYNTNVTNALNASGLLQSGGYKGVDVAQAADLAKANQANTLLQAGGLEDAYAQGTKQAPLNATNWMAGLTTPIAQLGNTSNSTQTTSTPPNIGGMIGGGVMAGLGAMTGNPMLIASGIGGMGSGLAGGSGSSGFPALGTQATGGGGFFGGNGFFGGSTTPGTLANGGWQTTVKPSLFGW